MHDWLVPSGYRFVGHVSGLRAEPNRRDLALIVSDRPAAVAGVFTQNQVAAAPVRVCRERVPQANARGIVICSGNANACTGEQGLADARRMTVLAAEAVGCRPEQFLVASTGVIGRPLPMPILEAGIPAAAKHLDSSIAAVDAAAHAILTTDTSIKVASAKIGFLGTEARLLGFAKGAAMIGPNMATMLAFLMTDAAVGPNDLQTVLRHSVARTFNCISVEGHTSTNDSVFLFANGEGRALSGKDLEEFAAAVHTICAYLAKAIARDAEGASHLVTIEVEGTRDDAEAARIAKTIAESALVKCAIFGADPNWGRIVSAAGYSGVPFEEKQLSLWLGDMPIYQHGAPLPFDLKAASNYLRHNREVTVRLRFTLSSGQCTFYTCDLTPEYIRLNADYTT
ncbi:MAG TPA: bifunctional glutamate N-acetyltransferase/amino-acid acetyltransferase ArgJ [Gemmataceae bacterium]|jgi:glutamate N-acetyltransferase/amino-acid N-acetyltransferase|nr:bifunctional glutamate N-acetyltransferase/amino-acid acetyltransferase ArgJ [Gemmataceae bacterium]